MKAKSRPPLRNTYEYARDYYSSQGVIEAFEQLTRYCPEVVDGYMTLRQGAFMAPPHGALPLKYKELTAVAIECALVIPSEFHARKAIDSGATVQEVAETVSLCIQLTGMVTYMHSGRSGLKAAEEQWRRIAGEPAKIEAASRPPLRSWREYAQDYYGSQGVVEAFELLAKYCPEVVEGYLSLRQGVFMEPPHGALAQEYKELMAVAIECAVVVPSMGHAKRAISCGATLHELAEVVSMCIQLGGMVTYMHSGRYALKAAEERVAELGLKR